LQGDLTPLVYVLRIHHRRHHADLWRAEAYLLGAGPGQNWQRFADGRSPAFALKLPKGWNDHN